MKMLLAMVEELVGWRGVKAATVEAWLALRSTRALMALAQAWPATGVGNW
jgi:hypothetical protein